MDTPKPIFLRDVADVTRHLGLPDMQQELRAMADIDPVVLRVHQVLKAAGVDTFSAFSKMGFALADRGVHGQGGETSPNTPSAHGLARHLGDRLSPTARGLIYYVQDLESAVRLAEQELGAEAPIALRGFLVESGLYPDTLHPEALTSPIAVQLPFQQMKLSRVAERMAARWSEAKFKKKRSAYDAALKAPPLDDPTPTQVAALLMPFIAGDCAELAAKGSYQEALGAAIQMFYLTGLKQTPSPVLLAEAGLYPVPADVPNEERALRERVGRDLFDRFSREEQLRAALAEIHVDNFSLQQLGCLRRSSHQTDYELAPEDAVNRVAAKWVLDGFGH